MNSVSHVIICGGEALTRWVFEILINQHEISGNCTSPLQRTHNLFSLETIDMALGAIPGGCEWSGSFHCQLMPL